MLTEQMIRLISTYTIRCVATVRPDGGPAVSPKATSLVIDARTLAFENIRSEGTVENLGRHSDVEGSFIDIFGRGGWDVVFAGMPATLRLTKLKRIIEGSSRQNGPTCTA